MFAWFSSLYFFLVSVTEFGASHKPKNALSALKASHFCLPDKVSIRSEMFYLITNLTDRCSTLYVKIVQKTFQWEGKNNFALEHVNILEQCDEKSWAPRIWGNGKIINWFINILVLLKHVSRETSNFPEISVLLNYNPDQSVLRFHHHQWTKFHNYH